MFRVEFPLAPLRKATLLFVLALIAMLSAASGQSGTRESLEQLRHDIRSIMDEEGIPGASMALVAGGDVVWVGGLGKADIAGDVDATADTLFRVGSISKSFTALAVMKLVEQGGIDLDAPIRGLVPAVDYVNPWADTHPVTVAHLLEHTTGFDDVHFVEVAKDDDPDVTLESALAFHPHSRISRWPPGVHMSYCNSGPPLAALALEVATARDFEDYAREHVFEPLGMVDSTFRFPRDPDSLAQGYERDGATETRYDHILFRPSGALNTSSREMANYLRMMIGRGTFQGRRLFRPETIERMERPATTLAARAGHEFGYGLGIEASVVSGHWFLGHGGSTSSGFMATSAYSPELGVGYFIGVNMVTGRLRDMAELVVNHLTDGVESVEPPAATLDTEGIERAVGYYEVATPRSQIMNFMYRFLWLQRVWTEKGRLYRKPLLAGEKVELIPVSATSFRTRGQPAATLFLVADEQGTSYLQSGFEGHVRKVSVAWAWSQLLAGGLTLLLLLSAVLFGLVWLAVRALGGMRAVAGSLVLPQLLASVCLFGTFVVVTLTLADVNDLIRLSASTLALFLGTSAYAMVCLCLAFRLVRPVPATAGIVLRNWSRLVSVAAIAAALYLASEDIIGVRLWSY